MPSAKLRLRGQPQTHFHSHVPCDYRDPMRSRYKIVNSEGVYFVTSTIVDWLPVFVTRDAFEIMVKSLAFCRATKGLRIYAYVIMENHFHMVAEAPNLSGVMASLKSFTARELIQLAEQQGLRSLLDRFARSRLHYKMESNYQVWQEGFHPKLIENDPVLEQKVDYIHLNPVRRGYVDVPEHYRYSSARNYVLEDHSVLEIDALPL